MAVSGADFAAHFAIVWPRGLKPPASIRRPFGPETTLGMRKMPGAGAALHHEQSATRWLLPLGAARSVTPPRVSRHHGAYQFLTHFACSCSFCLSETGAVKGLLPPVDQKSGPAILKPGFCAPTERFAPAVPTRSRS